MNRLAPHNAAPRTRPYSRVRECRIEECGAKHYGLGLCRNHHARMIRNGDPRGGRDRYETPREALDARTKPSGDCLVWTGVLNDKGYGSIWDGRRTVAAHRYAHELFNGPIPHGTVIDHTCWNRACVNPEHLRAIPQRNNASYRSGGDPRSETGLRNITVRPNGRYQVSVSANGRRHYGGLYDDIENAKDAASALRTHLFGEYAGRG